MQTILGAGGPVSNALLPLLATNGQPVRLISRRPIAASGNASWAGADLKDYDALLKAASGASIIYMCAGLKYDKAVWKAEWPLIMSNLIRLAKDTGARVIFFDNVYMYGRVPGAMTEDTPHHPASFKGGIRAAIADMLMGEAAAGNIRATIARSADFYGTGGLNSFFDLAVLQRLAAGSGAQWMGSLDVKHSFTYIPDAAKALAILGRSPESDNQVWHLPTAPAITGRQLVQIAADAMGAKPKVMKVNLAMLRLMGLFNKLIGETAEMYYQYRHDYIFDSSKIETAYGLKPTSYEAGIRAAAAAFRAA